MVEYKNNDYFRISLELLNPDLNAIYPFHLFIYNPQSEEFSPFLYANSPLTKDKIEFLRFISSKGGSLGIPRNQEQTFLTNEEIAREEIEDLIHVSEHEFVTREKKRKQELEKKREEKPFTFGKELSRASESNDFSDLIKLAREEVLTFSYSQSHTLSLAIYLCERLLIEDNHINRIVAFSFHLAKLNDFSDEAALGDLIVAGYLSHLGLTQLPLGLTQMASFKMDHKQQRDLKKHPGLTQHLVRKMNILISERCNKIYYQHHERTDGNGYPEYKKGEFIEPLALILGVSAHLLEYSEGMITGDKTPLKNVLSSMRSKSLLPGLELNFGDNLIDTVAHLFTSAPSESKKAA